MKHLYVICLKYAGEWSVYGVYRNTPYAIETDRHWFVEAVRMAVAELGLRKEDVKSVEDATLNEVICYPTPKDEGRCVAMFSGTPVDGVSDIKLL